MPRLILLLAFAHGLSDGASGWLLGTAALREPPETVAWLFLVYNALAFGAQPLAGRIVDRGSRFRLAAAGGLVLIVLALVAAAEAPLVAAALAGCGSAFFHVSGGGIALRLSGNRAGAAGVFAAPGVLGLALGGVASALPWSLTWPLATAIAAVAVGVAAWRAPTADVSASPAGGGTRAALAHVEFDRHDLLMLLLLAAIALRSFVWTLAQAIDAQDSGLLLAIALAAATGKACGGWAADYVGWKRWTLGALLAAAPLLTIGGSHPAALAAGVMLLQSTMPVMLAMAGQLLPGSPATAAGLALGLGVALGGAPLLLGVITAPTASGSWLIPLATIVASGLTLAAGRPLRQSARRTTRSRATSPARLAVSAIVLLLLAPIAESRADILLPGSVPRVWCIGIANPERFPETLVTGYADFPAPGRPASAPGAMGQFAMEIGATKPYCSAKQFVPHLFVVPRNDFRPVNLPQNPTQVRDVRSAVEVDLGLTFPAMPVGVKQTLDLVELTAVRGARPTLRKHRVRYTFSNNSVEELPYGADGVRPVPTRIPPAPPDDRASAPLLVGGQPTANAPQSGVQAAVLSPHLIESPPAVKPIVVALLAMTGLVLAVVIRRRRR